jgi:hypothetical protein
MADSGLAEKLGKSALLSRYRFSNEDSFESVEMDARGFTLPGSLNPSFFGQKTKVITTSPGFPSVGNTASILTRSHVYPETQEKQFGVWDYSARSLRYSGRLDKQPEIGRQPLVHFLSAQKKAAIVTPVPVPLTDDAIAIEVAAEAEKRLATYRGLFEKLILMIVTEVRKSSIAVQTVNVRPAWSHEYEETGIVIDIEVSGPAEDRFTLWDIISNAFENNQASFSERENEFITEKVSVVVNHS